MTQITRDRNKILSPSAQKIELTVKKICQPAVGSSRTKTYNVDSSIQRVIIIKICISWQPSGVYAKKKTKKKLLIIIG
jgi:hypothetical protein